MHNIDFVGKNCSVDYCNMKDFLSFNCKNCREVFCLDHRSLDAHNCINKNKGNVRAVECPKCYLILKSDCLSPYE